jgi:hypothetical protein
MQNALAVNKMKTLQLYSEAPDPNLIIMGDTFADMSNVDWQLTPKTSSLALAAPGNVTLAPIRLSKSVLLGSNTTIATTSNGILGNNNEVQPRAIDSTAAASQNQAIQFYAETNTHADLKSMTDALPTTWAEYESVYVYPSDKLLARNYGFVYTNTDNTPGAPTFVDWSIGPTDGILRLNLSFEIQTLAAVNRITFTPNGLVDNRNNPVIVKSIKVSQNGTDWVTISPTDVWVGTQADLKTARAAENITIGSAMWSFEDQLTKFIQISIEQQRAIDADIGHIYYEQEIAIDNDPGATPNTVLFEGATPTTINDFEVASGLWSEHSEGTPDSLTFSTSSLVAYSGTKSAKLVNTGVGEDGDGVVAMNDYIVRTFTDLEVGKEYKITARCYVENFVTAARARRGLMVFDRANRIRYGSSRLGPAHDVLTWIEHEVKFKLGTVDTDIQEGNFVNPYTARGRRARQNPPKDPRVEVRLYAPKGTVYWDAVVIDEVQTAAPVVPSAAVTKQMERVQGPIPSLSNPTQYYRASGATSSGARQGREVFRGKRWVIGITDIEAQSVTYGNNNTLVTKPFRAGGAIDRVALEADLYIPPSFATENIWVKFYVSPDDGFTWFPISRIEDSLNDIPEILAFNDPTPEEFRESGVGYHTYTGTINALRLRVDMSRPGENANASPILRSFRLKMRRR